MNKKEYSRPELTLAALRLGEVICSSVEDYGSQVNPGEFSTIPDDFDEIID